MSDKQFKFDANLPFQLEAIQAITDIFEGQNVCQSNFTVKPLRQQTLGGSFAEQGYGNALQLIDEEILENVHAVQLRNGLAQSSEDVVKTRNFSIWMETGTGKTYVYLRTIFELNKLYGFTKFIIVVPSIAIKEGVYSSLNLMKAHFKAQYNNTPFDYFIYDSDKLNQVRNFAVSSNIQIMIINIDAFRKAATEPSKESKANIIHRYHDKMLGRPIDFISSCNPIVIIDEPQSVDNTDKAKEALALLHPLCTLRYSATHRKKDRYCMMYKLDSVDACEQKLVKQIEVAGLQVEHSHNKAYIRLVSVSNKNGDVTARLEIDVLAKGAVTRKTVTVKRNDNLFTKSGKRGMYDGYVVDDISCLPGDEYVLFLNQAEPLRLDKVLGGVNDDNIKRLRIRKTIEEHLEKELRCRNMGIKVLSLFFIDRVSNYRTYDNGKPGKGKYALWFEEEYRQAIAKPRYHTLFNDVDTTTLPEKVHDGYFSMDKKGISVNTNESTAAGQADAERGYQLIMKDKKLLLSFESPVKFIFSHSALKEGWDNPNIFQICTLNEISSDMRRRQMIGRGLRICVNQNYERVMGLDVNTLTIMANESFADFADNLQKEIEEEEDIRFGQVEEHSFANITVKNVDGKTEYLGLEHSRNIYRFLQDHHYISSTGTVQSLLKEALRDDTIVYPEAENEHRQLINAVLKKIAGSLNIKNKDDARPIKLHKERFLSPEFKALWERIKYKTTFRVNFDPEKLINECARALMDESKLVVTYPKYIYGKGIVNVTQAGVTVTDGKGNSMPFTFQDFDYPDVISYLQNETNLTRRSLARILIESQRLDDFKKNPQMFIDGAVAIIKEVMAKFIVDGIKYHKLSGSDNIWAQELFESEELVGYLNQNMIATPNKGIYEYTVYDSDIEREFAEKLDANDDVKVFAKLPDWFKIPTPLGTYNPDWAILVKKDGQDRLFFVVETKGTDLFDQLPPQQQAKIECGRAHFAALGNENIRFLAPISSYKRFDDIVLNS